MKDFKGTKTEWHAVEFAGFIILKDSDFYEGKNILDYSDVGEVVANANAKLAKNSFELLEMVEVLKNELTECIKKLNHYEQEHETDFQTCYEAHELIKKIIE